MKYLKKKLKSLKQAKRELKENGFCGDLTRDQAVKLSATQSEIYADTCSEFSACNYCDADNCPNNFSCGCSFQRYTVTKQI